MKVTVKRNPGDGEILGILFILEDDAGVEYRGLRISPIPNTLDSMIYEMNETTFDPSISNFEDITKVSIAFLYNTKNGNKTSDIEDSYDGSFRNVVFDRVVTPTTTIEALSGNVDSIFNDPFFGNIAFVFIGEVPDYQDRYLQIDDETIKICYKIKAHSINIFPGIDNDENEIQDRKSVV